MLARSAELWECASLFEFWFFFFFFFFSFFFFTNATDFAEKQELLVAYPLLRSTSSYFHKY